MFVCPDCKGALQGCFCSTCSVQFELKDGIPKLLSREVRFASADSISSTYDEIYTNRAQVWEDQGRTPEFIEYFSGLAAGLSTGSVLEVGCGEGYVLQQLKASEKAAIDLSEKAARIASRRAGAQCGVALAERLPFPDARFDVVVSIGVMEHFLDDVEATSEIKRVLRKGGWYLALIHVDLTFLQRCQQKLREYVFPKFRPAAAMRWLISKVHKPVFQPIQRRYTIASAKECLERVGFGVDRVISRATNAGVPLVGPHVVIYCARK